MRNEKLKGVKNKLVFPRMKKKISKEKDARINTSLITFRSYLAVFSIIYFLTVGQAFILARLLGHTPTLIGVLAYYILVTGLIVTIILGVSKKYFYGRPLQRIAKAARQISKGDFGVRVESSRNDGKKDEIEVLIEDFNKMAEELSSVELLKSDFISNVSHEIKAPLSIIQSYTKALKDTGLSAQQRDDYADTVIAASQNLSVMVTNILKLNRLENQEIHPTSKPYQFGEQLRRCALFYLEEWQKKKIDFQIDVDDMIINYDESLLELVWNNLISNAVKFTEPGGRIALTAKKEEGYMNVVLMDSGCGMSPEIMDKIFDKFYQGDTSHATEGNGLGLSLVKKVVEIVGGKILVESQTGKGSTFTIKLKI